MLRHLRSAVTLLTLVLLATAGCGKKASSATQIKVAAAADLARAFEEVGRDFTARTGIKVTFSFGSTGLLAKQIEEGAPFDLFAAANIEFVDKVVAAGACDGSTKKLYARGRIVVWSGKDAPARLEDLADPKYRKIAIANPEHAPYGKAAKQALQKVGVWDAIESRMVYGENVQQTLQYAKSGNVEAAVVALSLAKLEDGGSSMMIDPTLHEPLDQALVVCGKGPAAGAAGKFADFVSSPEGREIMTRYGFLLPGETAPAPKAGGNHSGGGGGATATAKLDEAAVRAVVDAWLAAQNGGDFAAYQALYAERFGGIKRVGPRTWKFDRKGWLADRDRMFKASMTVTAEDVEIHPVGTMAEVRFRQTYQQGKFKDAGDKQLVIVQTGDGLRIAREEMLRSTLIDGPGSAKASGFAVLDDGQPWLVVGDGAGVATTGAATLGSGGDGQRGFEYSTRQTPAGLGEAWTKLIGSKVTVYPSEASCTIAGFRVLTVLTPHFGTVAEWSGDSDGDGAADAAKLEGDALAEAIAGSGAVYLVADIAGCASGQGDVVGVIGDAGGAMWVHDVNTGLEGKAAAAFAKLDTYQQLQADYRDSYGGQGEWTEADNGVASNEVWRSADGKTRYALVSASAGNGCGDFSGALTAVFRQTGDGDLERVGEVGGEHVPTVVVDSNRDGQPELAGHASMWTWDGKGFQTSYELDLGFRDCGC